MSARWFDDLLRVRSLIVIEAMFAPRLEADVGLVLVRPLLGLLARFVVVVDHAHAVVHAHRIERTVFIPTREDVLRCLLCIRMFYGRRHCTFSPSR